MKAILGFAPIVLAVPLLLVAGIRHGIDTQRWSGFPELKVYAARLEKIPTDIGPWKGEIGPKVDRETALYGGIEGDRQVTYTNQDTGERVNMFIVVGRLVDVAAHTPDRCYPAQGYHMEEEEPSEREFEISDTEKVYFKQADFTPKDASATTRMYWCWSTDIGKNRTEWLAPKDDIRDKFERTQPIYKLYIDHLVHRGDAINGPSPAANLIKSLIPELDKVLFTAAPAGSADDKAAAK